MNFLTEIAQQLKSRKLVVGAGTLAAAGTGSVELTWPMAAVACAYVLAQAIVDKR